MNLESKTKKELLEIIDLKNSGIDSLRNKLRESEDLCINYRNEINDLQIKVRDVKRAGVLKDIDSISDIKSVQTLLYIYKTDSMTHREKAYLGEKIDHVINAMVERKNEDVLSSKRSCDLDSGLPF